MSFAKNVQQSWDPIWENIFNASREWSKYPSEHVIRFVAGNWYRAVSRHDIKILDMGCGPGNNTWYMAREGFAVSAIDGSAKAISLLETRLRGEHLQAEARVGDYLALPWPEHHFDGIVEYASLMHNTFEKSKLALQEARRVLKPGGLLLSVNPSTRFWGCGEGKGVEPNGFVDIPEGPAMGLGFTRFMTRAQVEELYQKFSDVTIDSASWTVQGGSHTVEFWLVTCRK